MRTESYVRRANPDFSEMDGKVFRKRSRANSAWIGSCPYDQRPLAFHA
jgi:hypothetical protein